MTDTPTVQAQMQQRRSFMGDQMDEGLALLPLLDRYLSIYLTLPVL